MRTSITSRSRIPGPLPFPLAAVANSPRARGCGRASVPASCPRPRALTARPVHAPRGASSSASGSAGEGQVDDERVPLSGSSTTSMSPWRCSPTRWHHRKPDRPRFCRDRRSGRGYRGDADPVSEISSRTRPSGCDDVSMQLAAARHGRRGDRVQQHLAHPSPLTSTASTAPHLVRPARRCSGGTCS